MMILPFSAIFQRGAMELLCKELAEITAGAKAAELADGGDGVGSAGKHPAGELKPVLCEVFDRAQVHRILKDPVTFPLAQVRGGRKLCNGDFFGVMLVEIGQHGFDAAILFPVGRLSVQKGFGLL